MNAYPIALFVFKRPEHTERLLGSLLANPGLHEYPIYIFCDGARNADDTASVEAVRLVVDCFEHPQKAVFKQATNLGLARSIMQGVTKLCDEYGHVIVLEDDLVLAPQFLNFMRQGLDRYVDEPRVMQVSGHTFPVASFTQNEPALLLPFVGSWGWATWKRAWQKFDADAPGWRTLLQDRQLRHKFDLNGAYPYSNMLLRQMRGDINSWAIRWNWAVFQANGLVLYPSVSLVNNVGFDGSGTHCSTSAQVNGGPLSYASQHQFPDLIETDFSRFDLVRASIIQSQGSLLRRTAKRFRHFFHRWVP